MTDLVVPAALRFARSSFRYVDNTGITRGVYSGVAQTTSYGGDRVAASIEFRPSGGRISLGKSERAQMQSLLMQLRGRQNRIYLRDDANERRGSFPTSELFANADFSNGSTGWSADSSTLIEHDGVLRLNVTAPGFSPALKQSIAFTQYVPYVMRAIFRGSGTLDSLNCGGVLSDGTVTASYGSTTRSYFVASMVPVSASSNPQYPAVILVGSGYDASDFLDVQFASLSRCFLVDGSSNLALQSDTLATTWSISGGSVASNAVVSPDGTTTAEEFDEGATSVEHSFSQVMTVGASANDHVSSCCFKATGRNWIALRHYDSGSGSEARCYFNMTNGAIGTASIAAGTVFANARGYSRARGNGWFQFYLVSRKTTPITSITSIANSTTGDGGSLTPAGISANAFYFWRGGFQQSAVPGRTVVTTSSTAAAQTQTGSGLNVKGLPASTTGLLLAGDWVEIDNQLKMVTVSLDSDAAGLGYLQFSPPLRRAVSDNSPVIVHRPMGRFVLAGDATGWGNDPGVFSSASLELEEAFA